MERALLDGKMEVKDVPKEWNKRMEQYLGCTPETDAKGCLQDVVSNSTYLFFFFLS